MWELHKGITVIITLPVAVVQKGCPGGCKLLQAPLGQPGPVMLTEDETFGAAGSQERAMLQDRSNLQSIFSANLLYVYCMTSSIYHYVLNHSPWHNWFGLMCVVMCMNQCVRGGGWERMCEHHDRFAVVKLIKAVTLIPYVIKQRNMDTVFSFVCITHWHCARNTLCLKQSCWHLACRYREVKRFLHRMVFVP